MALAMLNTTTQMTASDFSFVAPAEDTPAVEYDDSFLGELEIEYLEKVSQIRSLTERLALRLESSFRYELLKLPLAVRSMTMREFCEQCGGDVEQAIQHAAKRRKAATELMPPPSSIMQPPRSIARPKALRDADVPAGLRNSRRQAASMTATPMGGARATRGRTAAATPGGAVLSTPSVGVGAMPMLTPRMHETPRFARTGEVMLSANGSPINVLHTIKAKAGKRGRTAAAVVLEMADGTELDLSEEATRKDLELNAEARVEAVGQLLELQAQIEAHIRAIKEGCPTDDTKED